MKIKRIFSALMSTVLLLSAFSFTAGAAASTMYETFYYNSSSTGKALSYDVLHEGTGTVADVTLSMVLPAIKITPDKTGNPDKPLAIKHTNAESYSIPFADVDYIRIHYTYPSGSYRGRAMLKFPASKFNLTKDITVYSMDKIKKVSGSTPQFITFDVKEFTDGYIFEDGVVPTFEFYPFGEKLSGDLNATKDIFYISDIVFAAKGSDTIVRALADRSLVQQYPMYFLPGRADATGDAPEIQFAEVGGTITLPECTYTLEGYEFDGWIDATGNNGYRPGDTYTVTTRNLDGLHTTGRMYFIAKWKKAADNAEIKIASSSTYFDAFVTPVTVGGVSGQPGIKLSSTYTKNFEFDGLNTVKFEFFPDESDANRTFSLDCYHWSSLPLDISKMKYAAIPYYFKTESESYPKGTPSFTFLQTNADCLTKSISATTRS